MTCRFWAVVAPPSSPVFYETGGDPETHAAHLIIGGADGSHSDAGGGGEDGTDGGTDAAGAEAPARRSRSQVLTRDSFCVPPAGFIRSERMTNWPALLEVLWATIGVRCPSAAELQSLKTYRKREEECYKQFFAKLAKEAAANAARAPATIAVSLAVPEVTTSVLSPQGAWSCPASTQSSSSAPAPKRSRRVKAQPRVTQQPSAEACPDRTVRTRGHSAESLTIAALTRGAWQPLPVMRERCDVAAKCLAAASRDLDAAIISSEEAVGSADIALGVSLLQANRAHPSNGKQMRGHKMRRIYKYCL